MLHHYVVYQLSIRVYQSLHQFNLPHLEHLCEQVHDGRAEVAGNVELSALDLLKEHCDVVVIKWECPTEQGI